MGAENLPFALDVKAPRKKIGQPFCDSLMPIRHKPSTIALRRARLSGKPYSSHSRPLAHLIWDCTLTLTDWNLPVKLIGGRIF